MRGEDSPAGAQLAAESAFADVHVERILALADFPHYRTELEAHLAAPFPALGSVAGAYRLALARRIVGSSASRSALITNELRVARTLLARADSLIVKMIALKMTMLALHALSALPASDPSVVMPMTDAERSLNASMLGEFRFQAAALRLVKERPHAADPDAVPSWFGANMAAMALRPFFKVNRSLNAAYRCSVFTSAALRSNAPVSASDEAALASSGAHGTTRCLSIHGPSIGDRVLNPIGTILVSVGSPDFSRYAQRLDDLGSLIRLQNAALHARRIALGLSGQTLEQSSDFPHQANRDSDESPDGLNESIPAERMRDALAAIADIYRRPHTDLRPGALTSTTDQTPIGPTQVENRPQWDSENRRVYYAARPGMSDRERRQFFEVHVPVHVPVHAPVHVP